MNAHAPAKALEAAAGPRTLVAALAANARDHGREIAVRERERGIWRERAWAEVADDVFALAAGLEAQGLAAGATLTIVGDNRYRLYCAFLAANVLRATPAPVFADVPPDELAAYTTHGAPDMAVAEDQEQVDKLIALRAKTGRPARILYDDPRGLQGLVEPGLAALDDVMAAGRARLAAASGLRETLAARARPDDPAVLLHSSGTTGAPKGVVIRHTQALAAARNGAAGGYFQIGDEHYAYLPMAWVGDYTWTVAAGVALRFRINIPERQETVLHDLREVAPTLYLAAPRAWDNMLTRVQVGVADSTPLKRKLFDWFMPRAIAIERRRLAGAPPTTMERLLLALGEIAMFAPIRDALGLSRAKRAFTGGEALGEDTFLFFRALGVNLKQFYGQTETAGLTAAQADDAVRLHTVGTPLPGVELRVEDSGEILVRSGSAVDGYLGDPAAAARTFVDGWVRTGDAGRIEEDGQLVVLGRVSEVVRTAGGERYVPNYIENRLKFSPFVRNVAVLGADRAFLAALVCIDAESVGHWAQRRGLAYTSYADLAAQPPVLDLLRDALAHVNGVLPQPLRMRRFIVLPKDFDADDGEITRTRKLRRTVIEDRYAPLIEAIYAGAAEIDFDAAIIYESGERGAMRRRLAIVDVAPGGA